MLSKEERNEEVKRLLEERGILNFVWPVQGNLKKSIEEDIRHSCRVEYVCSKLNIKTNYPNQQPHDMNGEGNKLLPEVAFPLAIGWGLDKDDEDYGVFIRYGVNIHNMGQKHHDSKLRSEIKLRATDSLVTMTEERGYNGGPYNMQEIKDIIEENETGLMKFYMLYVAEHMENMKIPCLSSISLDNLESIIELGLPDWIEKLTIKRANEAIELYGGMGYKLKDVA
jgi:hypothetical protein